MTGWIIGGCLIALAALALIWVADVIWTTLHEED